MNTHTARTEIWPRDECLVCAKNTQLLAKGQRSAFHSNGNPAQWPKYNKCDLAES